MSRKILTKVTLTMQVIAFLKCLQTKTNRFVSLTKGMMSLTKGSMSLTKCSVSLTKDLMSLTKCLVSLTKCLMSLTNGLMSLTKYLMSLTKCLMSLTKGLEASMIGSISPFQPAAFDVSASIYRWFMIFAEKRCYTTDLTNFVSKSPLSDVYNVKRFLPDTYFLVVLVHL